jgi:hypothetical protein
VKMAETGSVWPRSWRPQMRRVASCATEVHEARPGDCCELRGGRLLSVPSRFRLVPTSTAVGVRFDRAQRVRTVASRTWDCVHREQRHLERPVGDGHVGTTCRTKGRPELGHEVAVERRVVDMGGDAPVLCSCDMVIS